MSNEEEDDYMSETFLTTLNEVRPGLLTKTQQLKTKAEEKLKSRNEQSKSKSKKQQEIDARQQGLASAISSENKGFAMLQKMGFKPGTGLGKNNVGRSEPITFEVKTGRCGLGRQSEVKRKIQAQQENLLKRQRMLDSMKKDYIASKSSQFDDLSAKRDLCKSQKVCEQLDSQQSVGKPGKWYFWPEVVLPLATDDDLDQDEEEDDVEIDDKLNEITEYLRSNYCYCVWCAIQFEDEEDMISNCPGGTSQAHND